MRGLSSLALEETLRSLDAQDFNVS